MIIERFAPAFVLHCKGSRNGWNGKRAAHHPISQGAELGGEEKGWDPAGQLESRLLAGRTKARTPKETVVFIVGFIVGYDTLWYWKGPGGDLTFCGNSPLVMSVSIYPGTMALTRTPAEPYSSASARVRPAERVSECVWCSSARSSVSRQTTACTNSHVASRLWTMTKCSRNVREGWKPFTKDACFGRSVHARTSSALEAEETTHIDNAACIHGNVCQSYAR